MNFLRATIVHLVMCAEHTAKSLLEHRELREVSRKAYLRGAVDLDSAQQWGFIPPSLKLLLELTYSLHDFLGLALVRVEHGGAGMWYMVCGVCCVVCGW